MNDPSADIVRIRRGCQFAVMFRKALSFLLLSALLGTAYVFAWSPHASYNRAGIIGTTGRIDSGAKFGVTIGDVQWTAQKTFWKAGFYRVESTKPQSCHGFEYSKTQNIEVWFDDSWRRGTLCVVSSESKITHLSWSYGFGSP